MIPRMVLGGMTMIVNGMQVFFTGFVLGILAIPRRNRTQKEVGGSGWSPTSHMI
jgi:hypothetical protein